MGRRLVTLSPRQLVTLSPRHLVTASPRHLVTSSPCHLVTSSYCHPVTSSSRHLVISSPRNLVTLSPCQLVASLNGYMPDLQQYQYNLYPTKKVEDLCGFFSGSEAVNSDNFHIFFWINKCASHLKRNIK